MSQGPAIAAAALLFFTASVRAQDDTTPVRRAVPVGEPPVARAVPVEPTVRRALPLPEEQPTAAPARSPNESSPNDNQPNESEESPGQRQLDYANGLFGRKLYDLAVP